MVPIHLYFDHIERNERVARELRNDRLAAQLRASRVLAAAPRSRRRGVSLVARLAR